MGYKEREFTSYGSKYHKEKSSELWDDLFYEIMNEEAYGDEEGDVETLDSFFKSIKEPPAYRYVIAHLCKNLDGYEEENLVEMFGDIESGNICSEKTEKMMRGLAVSLQEKYEEKTKKTSPDLDTIVDKLLHVDRDFCMEFLIWTLERDSVIEDSKVVNGLLTVALGEQGLDYYNPEQFLTYLAFAYKYKGTRSRYEIFRRLQEIYADIEIGSKTVKKINGTIAIREKANAKLNDLELSIDENVSYQLLDLLCWQKSLKTPDIRTIGTEYESVLDEVIDLYDTEIQNFFWNCEQIKEEKKDDYIAYLKRHQRVPLTITYNGETDPDDPKKADGTNAAVLKKGTVFSGKNFLYVLDYDVALERRDRIKEIPIPVKAVSDHPLPPSAPNNDPTLPANAELKLCDKNGVVKEDTIKKYNVSCYTFPTGKKTRHEWDDYRKPAYNSVSDKGKGCILIDARPGFEIVAGETCFVYEENGIKYLYEAKYNAVIECKRDITPYFDHRDIIECLIKESNPFELETNEPRRLRMDKDDLLLEESGQEYKTLKWDPEKKFIEGVENIRKIWNSSSVILKNYRAVEQHMGSLVEEVTDAELKKAMIKGQKPLMLDIEYPANQTVTLKKGTAFISKAYLKKEMIQDLEEGKQNRFVLFHDVVLPPSNERTIAVQVVSTDKQKRPGVKEEMLNKKAKIRWEQEGNDYGRIISVQCGNTQKPRLYGNQTDGYLYVTCECGTVIDRSIRFIAEMGGQEFVFLPVEEKIEVSSDFVVYKNLPVYIDETTMTPLSTGASGINKGKYTLAMANTFFEAEEPNEEVMFGMITSEEKYLWNPEAKEKVVNKAAFFEYLYSLKDYKYFEDYMPNLNMENLSVEWFRKMFPENWTKEEFCQLPKDQARSVLMTLLFLKAAKEKEKQMSGSENGERARAGLASEDFELFTRTIDDVMYRCRMDEFYMGKPCDCLLSYLYVCDSPVDALRTLFKLNKGRRK